MEEIQFGKHINNCKDSRKCLHRMHNNVTIVNAIEVQEGIVVIHGKIRNKRRNMEEKRDVIYLSSREAFLKVCVLALTIGISIVASLFDYKSCYVTILVQACNNMYDFYQFTDNKKYSTMVKRESIAIVWFAIIAIIVSIVAILELYVVMKSIWIKLLVIFFVTIPLAVVYNDYKIKIEKENRAEA